MLVDAEAAVSEQDQDGLTALMNAAEIGAGEIVTYLLNKGYVMAGVVGYVANHSHCTSCSTTRW